MKLLLTGANGFVGAQMLAGLAARGHTVVAGVRNPERLRRKWPGIEAIAVDFNHDIAVDTWRKRVAGMVAFRPIHVDDLVETVARVVEDDRFARLTLEPVGPDIVTLRDAVLRYRQWLGLAPAVSIALPMPLLRVISGFVDLAGGGPLGSAALQQVIASNIGHEAPGTFEREIGFRSASMDERLAERPAQTQDLWHARLYLLRPLLRLALVVMWLASAFAGFLAPAETYASVASALEKIGLPPRVLAIGFSVLDLVIAAALLLNLKPRLLAAVQLAVVLGYTLGLGILVPSLWLDPFGALVKNLPTLVAIGIWAVLEQER